MGDQIARATYGNFAGFKIATTRVDNGPYTVELTADGDDMPVTRIYDFPTFFAAVKAGKAEILRHWQGKL